MAWDALTSAMTDADSPVNQALMDAIRNRLDFLSDGTDISTDLVTADSIAAGGVHQAELNTSTVTVSTGTVSATGRYVVSAAATAAGSYGLYPTTFISGSGNFVAYAYMGYIGGSSFTSGAIWIGFNDTSHSANGFANATLRYVASSPPHFLGSIPMLDLPWIYIVRNPDGTVATHASLDDPPWDYYHGQFKDRQVRDAIKRDPFASGIIPHPFRNDAIPAGGWIELLDMRHMIKTTVRRPAMEALSSYLARCEKLGLHDEKHQTRLEELAAREDEAISRGKVEKLLITEGRLASVKRASEGRSLMTDIVDDPDELSSFSRCISMDPGHPDFKHLPKIPGLFIPGQDGTAPRIRLMSKA